MEQFLSIAKDVLDALWNGPGGEYKMAIFWWIPMAIGAAAGAAKHALIDRPAQQKQRAYAAEMNRWSPWTKQTVEPPKGGSMFGSMLQGGATGLSMGQGALGQKAGVGQIPDFSSVGTMSNVAGQTDLLGVPSDFTQYKVPSTTSPWLTANANPLDAYKKNSYLFGGS